MPDGITVDHAAFASNRDTPFLFRAAGAAGGDPARESVRLELVEIHDLAPHPGRSGEESGPSAKPKSFSLLFRGPAGTPLAQGTYSVEHEAMGSFVIFIVPVSRDGNGMSYEAVFNFG
jgi:hypothetical protein